MAERDRLKKLLNEAFIKSDDNYGMPNTNQVTDYLEIYFDEIVFVDDSDNVFTADDIGKTVFLTREEAEKALKERSEK